MLYDNSDDYLDSINNGYPWTKRRIEQRVTSAFVIDFGAPREKLRDAISERSTGIRGESLEMERFVSHRGDTLIAIEASRFNCRDHARDKPDRLRGRYFSVESERE